MCPRPRPCPWRISREPGALPGVARLGYARRSRSGERAPDDDRAAARRRVDRRRDAGRRLDRPVARRPVRAVSIRSPARGSGSVSGIRAGDRRRRERGPRRRRHTRPRARRPGGIDQRDGRRREPAPGATAQRPGRAARDVRPGSGGRPRAVAAAHRGDSARCGARRGRDRPRARPGAARPHLSRGHDQRAGRAAARRRRGGLRPRRGDGGHAAPGGPGAGPAVVRRGRGERSRGRVAAMSTAPRGRPPAFGRSLLRLFTVQGSWNYERMPGVGMGVAEEPLLQRATAVSGPAMAFVVGVALPLAAQYLSRGFVGWSRVALAGVAAGGFALLWALRARLTGVRLGLALLALATLAGWLWP